MACFYCLWQFLLACYTSLFDELSGILFLGFLLVAVDIITCTQLNFNCTFKKAPPPPPPSPSLSYALRMFSPQDSLYPGLYSLHNLFIQVKISTLFFALRDPWPDDFARSVKALNCWPIFVISRLYSKWFWDASPPNGFDRVIYREWLRYANCNNMETWISLSVFF